MNNVAYQLYVWLDVAWRRRYVIAIPFLIMPIIGFAVGLVSPKTYTAHTSMLIQETSKLNPFLEDFAVSAMLKERLSALQTLLHSRHVLYKVAVDRGLIDEKSSKVEQGRAIYLLSSSLRMEMSGKDLIRIQYTASDPEVIEPILQTLSGYFIEQLLAPERSSMEDSSEFLMDLLADRKVELERSENALAAFKNKHAEQLPELHMGNVSRLAQLKNRLFEREAELAGALNSLGTIDQQLSKTNPVMAKLEEEKIKKLQSFVANKEAIIKEIGARTVAYNLIFKLQEQLEKIEVEQKEFTDEIEKEHGPCSINIADGEITPIEKKEE